MARATKSQVAMREDLIRRLYDDRDVWLAESARLQTELAEAARVAGDYAHTTRQLINAQAAEIERLRAALERAYNDGYDAAESHAAFGLLPGD